jgi:polyhydroxyalkanoate synthase
MLASLLEPEVEVAPSRRDEIARLGGTARLLRFGRPPAGRRPLLIVPSLINRWYVVDLRRGASLVGALGAAGVGVYALDWGVPEDEDRYLEWDEVVARIGRAVRRVLADCGAAELGLLGYCMGGTVSAIAAALRPEPIAAFVNLAGPIDFSKAGMLGHLVDRRWFDAGAIADAGNVSPEQMQSGFGALRPTLELAKIVRTLETAGDPEARMAGATLERWASDNIPFPAAAYRRYIGDLYQDNQLVAGTHRIAGEVVDLGRIRCPVLSVVATRDTICPADAATAIGPASGSTDVEVLEIRGGHVGAVVGSAAQKVMYPALAAWLTGRL